MLKLLFLKKKKLTGKTINEYKLIEEIGEGCFGTVYLVEDQKNEKFAINLIVN